jgi:hypothetical protein
MTPPQQAHRQLELRQQHLNLCSEPTWWDDGVRSLTG